MKKFFDMEIDGQVELENGKTLGELKESSISITDADVSGDSGVDALILVKREGANYVGEIVFGDYANVSQKIVSHKGVNVQIMHEDDDPEHNEYVYYFYSPMSITATTSNGEGGIPYWITFEFHYSESIPFDVVSWNADGEVNIW